jgi:hypothetical protein
LKTVLSGSTSTVAVVFVIVTADEARELTGLDLDELLRGTASRGCAARSLTAGPKMP